MVKCKFLAKCPAEFREKTDMEGASAWMACHFSLADRGITNLPEELPSGSLLILDDQIPIHGHDPARIRDQLTEAVEAFSCPAVLLDLEREKTPEIVTLVEALKDALPCPLVVPASYGDGLSGPVFLPPVPPDTNLSDYLAPWQGRPVYLEAALGGDTITLTEQGVSRAPLSCWDTPAEGFPDTALHCHYSILTRENAVQFSLWRTPEDLQSLLDAAEAAGVVTVGLYQELRSAERPQGTKAAKGL